jgi:creatinine amidohydrolase
MPRLAILTAALTMTATAFAQTPDTIFLEELTWTEVRDAVAAGTTTIIIPTAGTEQKGPHMVLGAHRFVVNHAADLIARHLGNALVAPVITHVPEGNLDPPSGHMRYAGTITLPNEIFTQVIDYSVRSLAVHGFTDIILIGDSGGNQRGMKVVADRLNAEWMDGPVRVHFVGDYYSNNEFRAWLESEGETAETIGGHAGLSDTSQLLHVAPEHIRDNRRAPQGGFNGSGVSGDPTRASAERGRRGIEIKVDAAINQINALLAAR